MIVAYIHLFVHFYNISIKFFQFCDLLSICGKMMQAALKECAVVPV